MPIANPLVFAEFKRAACKLHTSNQIADILFSQADLIKAHAYPNMLLAAVDCLANHPLVSGYPVATEKWDAIIAYINTAAQALVQ